MTIESTVRELNRAQAAGVKILRDNEINFDDWAMHDAKTEERREARIETFDWSRCVDREPPEFQWAIPHWLSMHPTLLAGRGGVGKSLLAQCMGSALATAQRYIAGIERRYRVGLYMCEDDDAEIWRRQIASNLPS